MTMKRPCLALLVVVCAASMVLAQGGAQFTFDQLFPPAKQRAMGLQKLTQAEKAQLQAHVETLMSAAMRGAANQTPPAKGAGPPKGGARVYAGVKGGHWIKQNIDNGSFILLEDRSLWQIDPLDKINAMLWLKISNITVVKSSKGSPGYDYLLINTDDGEKAHAKYMGKQ
jgi:hypothetical protein